MIPQACRKLMRTPLLLTIASLFLVACQLNIPSSTQVAEAPTQAVPTPTQVAAAPTQAIPTSTQVAPTPVTVFVPTLTELNAIGDLQSVFNAHAGVPRLILLLSPT